MRYQELPLTETLEVAQEVIHQVEALVVRVVLTEAPAAVQEAVAVIALAEVVLVADPTAAEAALEVQVADHLDHLDLQEVAAAEETKINHLSKSKYCYEKIFNFRNTNGMRHW